MKNKTLITLSVICVLVLVGWIVIANLPTVGGSFGYGMPGPAKQDSDDRVVVANAPPQVVYRLDDHRFLTLENYIACGKSGQMYYNDTKLGIKTRLEIYNRDLWDDNGNVKVKDYYTGDDQIQMKDVQNAIMAYEGLLINNAKNGALAFPYVNLTWIGCNNNYGCKQGALVSVDKGKIFYRRDYERSHNSPNIRTAVIVDDNYYYIGDAKGYSYGIKKIPLNLKNDGIEYKNSDSIDLETVKNKAFDIKFHCDDNLKPSQVKFVKPNKKEQQ